MSFLFRCVMFILRLLIMTMVMMMAFSLGVMMVIMLMNEVTTAAI